MAEKESNGTRKPRKTSNASAGANKTRQAYEILKQRILTGELPSGSRLPERPLQEELGISRTPIKSALEKLRAEGFLELGSDNVAIVSKIGFSEVLEIYELREAIEQLSARLAAKRHTESDLVRLEAALQRHAEIMDANDVTDADIVDADFHMIIAEASRNSQIVRHLAQLIEQSRRASIYQNQTNTERIQHSIEQHRKVLDAIRAYDADSAAAAMTAHLKDVIATTKDLMANYYFMYK